MQQEVAARQSFFEGQVGENGGRARCFASTTADGGHSCKQSVRAPRCITPAGYALDFADCGSLAKLTALLAQGAAKLHAMSEAGDEDMLRSAPGEGRFAPY